jgi:hypothetical protein
LFNLVRTFKTVVASVESQYLSNMFLSFNFHISVEDLDAIIKIKINTFELIQKTIVTSTAKSGLKNLEC